MTSTKRSCSQTRARVLGCDLTPKPTQHHWPVDLLEPRWSRWPSTRQLNQKGNINNEWIGFSIAGVRKCPPSPTQISQRSHRKNESQVSYKIVRCSARKRPLRETCLNLFRRSPALFSTSYREVAHRTGKITPALLLNAASLLTTTTGTKLGCDLPPKCTRGTIGLQTYYWNLPGVVGIKNGNVNNEWIALSLNEVRKCPPAPTHNSQRSHHKNTSQVSYTIGRCLS